MERDQNSASEITAGQEQNPSDFTFFAEDITDLTLFYEPYEKCGDNSYNECFLELSVDTNVSISCAILVDSKSTESPKEFSCKRWAFAQFEDDQIIEISHEARDGDSSFDASTISRVDDRDSPLCGFKQSGVKLSQGRMAESDITNATENCKDSLESSTAAIREDEMHPVGPELKNDSSHESLGVLAVEEFKIENNGDKIDGNDDNDDNFDSVTAYALEEKVARKREKRRKARLRRKERKMKEADKQKDKPLSEYQPTEIKGVAETTEGLGEETGSENDKREDSAALIHQRDKKAKLKKRFKSGGLIKAKMYSPVESAFKTLTTYRRFLLPRLFQSLSKEVEALAYFQISSLQDSYRNICEVTIDKESDELKRQNFSERPSFAPFGTRQAIILSSEDEKRVWFTKVLSQTETKKTFKLILQLYGFRQPKMPLDWSHAKTKLLPGSAVETRMLEALVRIQESRFLTFVLGRLSPKNIIFNKSALQRSENLNYSQLLAVNATLKEKYTVIRGPPGTGKTSVISAIIRKLLDRNKGWPILCVAESNVAVDNLCERLLDVVDNASLLRVTSVSKELEYSSDKKLGKACLHNKMFPLLPGHLRVVKKLLLEKGASSIDAKSYRELMVAQSKIKKRLISKAKVVLTTNITSGGLEYKDFFEFGTVIMDESTQATELSSLVPVSLPGVEKIVLVGDEKQLSSFASDSWGMSSLFERTLNNKRCFPMLLDTQYRMHPLISEFPATKFYEGLLKDGISFSDRKWSTPTPVISFHYFKNAEESQKFAGQGSIRRLSYQNAQEAAAVLKIVQDLIFRKSVSPDQIGVIATYAAQRDLIAHLMERDPLINPKRSFLVRKADMESAEHRPTVKATLVSINGIKVATVDAFQGHERNFIILSCVRSNKTGKIGFTSDKRRLNVALTRARYGLFIVGDKETLTAGSKTWRTLIKHFKKKDALIDGLKGIGKEVS
ncbi:LAME_0D10858g1_1 [Lachancea meyersii CBS 8951]|uniref:LAME_0D10858g1_1 n=1 Tax=Lachancea meyersii CBS 8951 TaxID=1266667 RepID=A0A1G4JC52_9SACH|nr:LAME_0D10858g1_1 [Lachancea meyersii CBS 8951]